MLTRRTLLATSAAAAAALPALPALASKPLPACYITVVFPGENMPTIMFGRIVGETFERMLEIGYRDEIEAETPKLKKEYLQFREAWNHPDYWLPMDDLGCGLLSFARSHYKAAHHLAYPVGFTTFRLGTNGPVLRLVRPEEI